VPGRQLTGGPRSDSIAWGVVVWQEVAAFRALMAQRGRWLVSDSRAAGAVARPEPWQSRQESALRSCSTGQGTSWDASVSAV